MTESEFLDLESKIAKAAKLRERLALLRKEKQTLANRNAGTQWTFSKYSDGTGTLRLTLPSDVLHTIVLQIIDREIMLAEVQLSEL